MIKVAIIVGSTRPGRKADAVAKWVHEIAAQRGDAEYEVVDIKDFNLPLLDEPIPPMMARYRQPRTKAWAAKIAPFDAFVFVTPEYNHGIRGALKNALDFLYAEWNDKAAGFVGYGGAGGARAVEQLRLVMGELRVADVRDQVSLSLHEDFKDYAVFTPRPRQAEAVGTMLKHVVAWGAALKPLRAGAAEAAGAKPR
ncbi:MAG: NADPH-dependent FMN reductase [Elusimicrobiota bacterium]